MGRPRKRWEDEVNDFLKPEETEATNRSNAKNNHTWMQVAKQGDKWKGKEDECAAAGKKEKLTFNEQDNPAAAKEKITDGSLKAQEGKIEN